MTSLPLCGPKHRSLRAPGPIGNQAAMRMRVKKFLGVFALLGILILYALLVMKAAVAILPSANVVVELLFYAVAGMAWVVPVRYLIVWMNTPGRKDIERGEHV
jgi:uncharacterized protein DUF2842